MSSSLINGCATNSIAIHWQSGYGIFSVSESKTDDVRAYIASQEEHHAKHTFQDEYRRLLQAHRIKWDEKHVWD